MAKSKYRPKPTWKTAAKQPATIQIPAVRLSQCMIVKNEERNIEKALNWGKGIVCEQIVVDTGSTDRTVEIAERMGAKVYHFKWINDFAAAKNYAIEQASGDWIAFLDADEYFSPEDAKKLPQILFHIQYDPTYRSVNALSTAMAHLDDQNRPFQVNAQTRLFRNHPAIRYQFSIHEALTSIQPDYEVNAFDVIDLTIFHTGYAQSAFNNTGKLQRNIDALRRELGNDPNSISAMAYLADALMASRVDDYTESEALCQRVVSAIPTPMSEQEQYLFESSQVRSYDHLFCIFALCKRDIADTIALYQDAVPKYPAFPDFDFFMGEAYFKESDWENALVYYQIAEEKGNAFRSTYLVSAIENHLPALFNHSAFCYQQLGDISNTIRYATLTLKLNPYDERLLGNFIYLVLGNDPESTAPAMLSILRKMYDFTKLKDKLLLLKIAKKVGASALYNGVYDAFTPEEKAWFEAPRET